MKAAAARGFAALLLVFLLAHAAASTTVAEDFIEAHRPRLERLFAALDPGHPGTAEARALWRAGERAEAAAALAAWFAARAPAPGVVAEPAYGDDLLERAEAALDNRFLLQGLWERVPARPDGGLDWRHRGPKGDKERAWMLNRHDFFPILAEAWRRTGDERFRARLNFLWQDWILHNPYPGRLTFSPAWRALEAARRVLDAWGPALHAGDALYPETRLLALCSLLDHGDALRHHASFWGGNHLITEKLGLLALAAGWPEFARSAGWRAYAAARAARELLAQSYPDGSYKELSNHYQRVVLVNAQRFLQLLGDGPAPPEAEAARARIVAMWDFFARVMRPDGTGPLNNASDIEDNAARVRAVWAFHGRPDWLHIASAGAEGLPPAHPPSALFPWAGQAILRNHWGRDAAWVYFDAGPYGTAHQHVDRLHLSASLEGRPLLVDTGRYTYRPGPWHDWFKGPEGHSVLMLDGRPAVQGPRAVRRPMPVAFADAEGHAFAGARAHFETAHGAVPWTRAVLLDKRGFVLVADHLVAFAGHTLRANWHFHPDVAEDEARAALRLLYPTDGYNAAVATGAETPPLGGFFSPSYGVRRPAPVARFSGRIGRPQTLVWALQAPGEAPLAAEVSSAPGAPVLELRLARGGRPVAAARVRLHPRPELLAYEEY